MSEPDQSVRVPAPLSRPASLSDVTLTEVARSPQANIHGTVHGGEILKLADSTAAAVSARHSGGPTVTRALEGASFVAPVEVGSILIASGRLLSTGTTSMRVEVVVEKEAFAATGPDRRRRVAEAVFVMVHVDPHGRPASVPGLDPEPEATS